MRARDRRLMVIAMVGLALALAVGLASVGLRDAAAFFQTPSEFVEAPPPDGRAVRIGGLVETGSIRTYGEGIAFTLSDDEASIDVRFVGLVPNLFREGQCVIAFGARAGDGVLEAERLLAKHDETYRPPEIDAAPRLAESCGPGGQGEMSGASRRAS